MSRSCKKVPIIKYGGYGKHGKHWANKRVRKVDLSDGNNYRRFYESWDIFDYRSNLYRTRKIDGIPIYCWTNNIMTFDDIMEYWRK
jgi:hypothetical protein